MYIYPTKENVTSFSIRIILPCIRNNSQDKNDPVLLLLFAMVNNISRKQTNKKKTTNLKKKTTTYSGSWNPAGRTSRLTTPWCWSGCCCWWNCSGCWKTKRGCSWAVSFIIKLKTGPLVMHLTLTISLPFVDWIMILW